MLKVYFHQFEHVVKAFTLIFCCFAETAFDAPVSPKHDAATSIPWYPEMMNHLSAVAKCLIFSRSSMPNLTRGPQKHGFLPCLTPFEAYKRDFYHFPF